MSILEPDLFIQDGHVARQIEIVAPQLRNRLDELKRIEIDRLRKLTMKEHKLEEEMAREKHGAYNEDDESGRKWRTFGGNHQPTKHAPLGTVTLYFPF